MILAVLVLAAIDPFWGVVAGAAIGGLFLLASIVLQTRTARHVGTTNGKGNLAQMLETSLEQQDMILTQLERYERRLRALERWRHRAGGR